MHAARTNRRRRYRRLLKSPARCFDNAQHERIPSPDFHCLFPLALSPSKGVRIHFEQLAKAGGLVEIEAASSG